MTAPHDLFISHRWSDKPWVEALVTALEAEGVRCWVDQRRMAAFEAVSPAVEGAVAAGRALLAWYSVDYPRSRICLWELTLAYLAGEGAAPPSSRVLVVNPEPDAAHLHLGPLADRLAMPAVRSTDPLDHRPVAVAVAKALRSRPGVLGDLLPSVRPSWFGERLPLGSERFVGRGRELWHLHGLLRRNLDMVVQSAAAGRPNVACLTGLGGMGKTQLAEEYAIRFGGAYPGGVVWLDGLASSGDPDRRHDADTLRRQLRTVCQALNLDNGPDDSEPELRGRIAARLSGVGRVLWIVDDLPGGLSRGRLDRWLAPMPGASTIVTTRTTDYSAMLPGFEVDALEAPDGVALLRNRPAPAGRFDPDAAARIVAALGGHALAIDVSGARLSRTTAPEMTTFAADLEHPERAEIPRLGAGLREELPTGHETSILLTIRRSIEELDDDGYLVLALAGVGAPRPAQMSVELLAEAASRLADDEDGRDAQVADGCETAISLSLLRSGGAGSGVVDVHPVVAAVVRHLLQDECEPLRETLLGVLETGFANDDQDKFTPGAARRGRSAIARDAAQARYLTAGDPGAELEATVSGWVAEQDVEEGAYATAESRGRRALRFWEGRAAPDGPPWQATRLRSLLAVTMLQRGDARGAREFYEAQLAAGGFDAEDRNTLALQVQLASTYSAAGEHGSAVELLRSVSDTATRVLGPDHDVTLFAGNMLGSQLGAIGENEEAREVLERVLQSRTRLLGWTHPHTMNTRTNLAAALARLDRRTESREMLRELLDDRRETLGENHPHTVQILNNLAGVTEDPDEAARLYRDAASAYARTLGADHPETLLSTANLAGVRLRQMQLDEAGGLLDEVLRGRTATLGAEHPDTIATRHALALVERQRAVLSRGRDDPALARTVAEWLLLSDWDERLAFIADHPVLGDGRAADLLGGAGAGQSDDDRWTDHVELLREVAEAGHDSLADLVHPQHWRAVLDRYVDRADAAGLERMIGWRGWLTHQPQLDAGAYLFVVLLMTDRRADAMRVARATVASGPEAVAGTREVLDRLGRIRLDLAAAGLAMLSVSDGSVTFAILPDGSVLGGDDPAAP